MPWNGSGTFNRVYSWVADKAAGLDIIASRMDTDTDDIASNGFGNSLTRDGQGQPTANLPMDGFRHTGVQNAVNRSDYSAFGQVQDGLPNWTIAGGSADAITATYTPALATLNDGQLCFFRASAANVTTTPTFNPNGVGANVITKDGGGALVAGDIPGGLAECVLRYNFANTRWELLNPAFAPTNPGTPTSGHVAFTLATTAPTGWLMFNDGTMGSASSGATSASAANQAVFTLLFNGVSDSNAPLFTSTGGSTTRAGQGTAAAAWAANCRVSLPLTLGRALAVAGAGAGLMSRALGSTIGEETHLLALGETPSHTHANTLSDPGHAHNVNSYTSSGAPLTGVGSSGTFTTLTTTTNTTGITITNVAQGGGGAHNNMQPSTFLNAIVKQ